MKFELDHKQVKAYDSFMERCYNEDNTSTGAIGGRFSISFTCTSLGMIVKVKDCVTKKEQNLTNFDDW